MTPTVIDHFDGEFSFLSNFSPHTVVFAKHIWPTAEHCFQAMKTTNEFERKSILHCATPGKAKRLGRKVTLREDWEAMIPKEPLKVMVMRMIVRAKFTQHTDIRELLIATGRAELIEGNWWNDTFWGVCRGVGENHLGKILMQVRAELS